MRAIVQAPKLTDQALIQKIGQRRTGQIMRDKGEEPKISLEGFVSSSGNCAAFTCVPVQFKRV